MFRGPHFLSLLRGPTPGCLGFQALSVGFRLRLPAVWLGSCCNAALGSPSELAWVSAS